MKTISTSYRNDFRKWLKKYHKKETKVAVILYKRHTGKPAPTHRELIEEAICFGWIDTVVKGIDEDTYMRYFVKRNKKSSWSKNTLSYGKELLEKGDMVEEGLKFYKLGLQKPAIDQDIPKNPTIPTLLKQKLSKNKKAKDSFNKLPTSTKKMLYRWILRAKLLKTQEKRVKHIIKESNKGNKDILLKIN